MGGVERVAVSGARRLAVRSGREQERDRQWLAWIGRLWFVTVAELAVRFAVSRQQAQARIRRLEATGLLGRERRHKADLYAIYLTSAGAWELGIPGRRKRPRIGLQREHELAIVQFVAALELAAPHLEVLTERDCRRREADGEDRFSVRVAEVGRDRRRWPDVVVMTARGPVAVEFEFTTKSKERLRRIVSGYLASRDLAEVRFLVTAPLLAAHLARLGFTERPMLHFPLDTGPRLIIDAWDGVDPATRAAIRGAAGDLAASPTHVQHHATPRAVKAPPHTR